MLGQQAPGKNSTKSRAIPLLLKRLYLEGALVTIDAFGTRTDIVRGIRDERGDYCMSLKKNWPGVYADVEQLFNGLPMDIVFETNEKWT